MYLLSNESEFTCVCSVMVPGLLQHSPFTQSPLLPTRDDDKCHDSITDHHIEQIWDCIYVQYHKNEASLFTSNIYEALPTTNILPCIY